MGTINEKLTYLAETKDELKTMIEKTGVTIEQNDTFRSYVTKLRDGYIDIINNGTDDLYSSFDKVTGVGSNVSLSPTLPARLAITPIGACDQTTYTGKNKLDLSQCTFANCIRNAEGGITSHISDAYYCSIDATYLKDYILANKGNTITFSLDKAIADRRSSILIMGTRTGGETTPQEQNGADNTNFVTMQIASDWDTITTVAIRFNRSVSKITDTTTVFNNLMLEQSATPTSYEPYVGGIPSPSPDYSQVVKVVTGDNDIVVHNKNYFELSNVTERPGTTDTAIGKVDLVTNGFRLTKTVEAGDGHGRFTPYINLKIKAGTYKVVGTLNKSSNINNCYIGFKDNLTSFAVNAQTLNTNFTLNFDETGVRFYMNANADLNDYIEFTNLMFINSTETDLTYVEGQSQSKTINLGKNLLGVVDGTYQSNEGEVTAVVSNGIITLNGTTTQINFVPITAYTSYSNIKVGDNFTISANNSVSDSNVSVRTNPNSAYDMTCNSVNKIQTFTLLENRPLQLGLTIRVGNGASLSNYTLEPQLEKGSVATPYAPYFTPIELTGIGDYVDTIEGKTDDWKIVRYVKKVILDGSEDENWSFYLQANQLTTNCESDYLHYSEGGKC